MHVKLRDRDKATLTHVWRGKIPCLPLLRGESYPRMVFSLLLCGKTSEMAKDKEVAILPVILSVAERERVLNTNGWNAVQGRLLTLPSGES